MSSKEEEAAAGLERRMCDVNVLASTQGFSCQWLIIFIFLRLFFFFSFNANENGNAAAAQRSTAQRRVRTIKTPAGYWTCPPPFLGSVASCAGVVVVSYLFLSLASPDAQSLYERRRGRT